MNEIQSHRRYPRRTGRLELLSTRLEADHSRVVLRPFNLGWQASKAPSERALKLIENICDLTEAEVASELAGVLQDFEARHWKIEHVFERRFAELAPSFQLDTSALSRERQLLIGAYFCHEYTFSAAALMNPSIVPHPDTSGAATRGASRFIMSMRAVGEGHISSIAFREGFLNGDGSFDLWPQAEFALSAEPVEIDSENGTAEAVRNPESTISDLVLFPITDQQSNGLEDLRLVRFDHGADDREWIGTYTAYSGSSIRSELLRTRDFKRFAFEPIHGKAGRDKGMALFPRKIGGRYRMIGRQDGKNLYLLSSDRLDVWDNDGVKMMEPRFPWEFVQIGNCGSPVEIDEGWLMLTHGVGAMRKYSLGCALLDKDDPSKILARMPYPLLSAERDDRNGYVPNVVYTCGAMITPERVLFIPYGISDSAIGFGRIAVSELLAQMI